MKANFEKNLKKIAILQNGDYKYTWSADVHSYREFYKALNIWEFELPTTSLIEEWQSACSKPFYEGWCVLYANKGLYIDVYLKTILEENLVWFEMTAYLDLKK